MSWHESMIEANILRAIFILIVGWGFYEVWKFNQLVGNRRLGRFLWKVGVAHAFWILGSFAVTFLQYALGLETRVLASLPTFLFFGYISWSIRTRRRLLAETWHEDHVEGNELLNEVLDTLSIEKEKAIRELEQGR